MSHKPILRCLPGTPLQDRSVGELVAERPGRSRIFQSAGIDFCCQGNRTLRDACEKKGLPMNDIVQQLQTEQQEKIVAGSNPAELPPAELATYIVETHHGFLRRELPRLHAMSDRVAQVHGAHTPALVELFHIFTGMEAELASHMIKEEQVLFPAIASMSKGESSPTELDSPIACMEHEHEEVGDALARLRELSHEFQPPADACNTYRALFSGLHDLEEDLHKHIHLENAVLFPAAKAMTEKSTAHAIQ